MAAKKMTHYTIIHEISASPTDPLPDEKITHQLTRMYQGLHNIETAESTTIDDWCVVSDALNLMEMLVEMGVCQDTTGLLKDAMESLGAANQRRVKGMSMRLDGVGIKAVRAVLEDYAEVIKVLPARTMIRCHRLTEIRLRDILKGKKQKHDKRYKV